MWEENKCKWNQHAFPLNDNQFGSVIQLCPTLCETMDCSTPGFPVHHQLPELTQTHVHWVSDAIQPSHPLSSPSPPNINSSIHSMLTECPVTYLVPEARQTPATPSVVWQKPGWAGLCPLEEESLVQRLSSRALSSNQTASLTRNAPILPAMPDLLCYAFPINL